MNISVISKLISREAIQSCLTKGVKVRDELNVPSDMGVTPVTFQTAGKGDSKWLNHDVESLVQFIDLTDDIDSIKLLIGKVLIGLIIHS